MLARDTLGKLTLVETTTNWNDQEGVWQTKKGEQANSENINWELFQDPATGRYAFKPARYYGWRNYLHYVNGMARLYYQREGREVDGISSATSKYYADRGLKRTYLSDKLTSSTRLHISEWLDCIRGRRTLSCGIERGFEVAIASLMAIRSYREGRRIIWDRKSEAILNTNQH